MAKATPLVKDEPVTTLTPGDEQKPGALVTAESMWQELETTEHEDTSSEGGTPYISFYSAKSKPHVSDPLKAAGVPTDSYYLENSGVKTGLLPFRYLLLDSAKFFTKVDNNGQPIAASKEEKDGYSEHGIAAIIVLLGDTFVPATAQFRGGQYRGLLAARKMQELARKDPAAFAAQGESWKVALAANPPPPIRFIATASGQLTKSSGSGFDFIKGQGTANPPKIDDIIRFSKAAENPDLVNRIGAVLAAFRRRKQSIEKLIK